MRLSHLTNMASLKTTKTTSMNRKRKSKKATSMRCIGTRLQSVKPPEWNSSINNHYYGLSREELMRRREQRISKNLATAQVELYDEMKSAESQGGHSKQRAKSASPVMMGRGGPTQKPVPDLGQLLRRSEGLLIESRQLLDSTSISVPRSSFPDFSAFDSRVFPDNKFTDKNNYLYGEVNEMDYSQEHPSFHGGEATESCYLAGIFQGLRVEDESNK